MLGGGGKGVVADDLPSVIEFDLPETDELSNLSSLLLKRETGFPCDGAGVRCRPGRGSLLVVEAGKVVQLGLSQEPEVEQCRGKFWVDSSRRHLDERNQRQTHLAHLLLEPGVACSSTVANASVGCVVVSGSHRGFCFAA